MYHYSKDGQQDILRLVVGSKERTVEGSQSWLAWSSRCASFQAGKRPGVGPGPVLALKYQVL
jgi:hypothetical protein